MRIEGKIIHLRRLRASDHHVVLRALEDWPYDPQSTPVGAVRAMRITDTWAREHRQVIRPAPVSGGFNETLTILRPHAAGEQKIGLVRCEVADRCAVISLEALVPEERGKGYITETNILLMRYLFGEVRIERAVFDIAGDVAALHHVVHDRGYIARGAAWASLASEVTYHPSTITATAWATRLAQPEVAEAPYNFIP